MKQTDGQTDGRTPTIALSYRASNKRLFNEWVKSLILRLSWAYFCITGSTFRSQIRESIGPVHEILVRFLTPKSNRKTVGQDIRQGGDEERERNVKVQQLEGAINRRAKGPRPAQDDGMNWSLARDQDSDNTVLNFHVNWCDELTAAAPASEVEAVVRSPTNMAAAEIAAADVNKMTPEWRHSTGLLVVAMFVGEDLLANRRLQTLLLLWLDVRSLENI